MNKKTKSIIQFLILLSIGVLLVWLSFRAVWDEKDKILDSFKNANYFWVSISIIVSFLSHYLRAYRWNYLLKPTGYQVKNSNALGAVLVGYFANYGLPRMGELTRCTLMTKYEKVPFEIALGTVITERIVDMILLIIIFFLTLLAQFKELKNLTVEYIYDPLLLKLSGVIANPTKFIIIISVLLSVVFVLFYFRKKITTVLKGKTGGIIIGFTKGLSSVKDIEKKIEFIVLSIGIWAGYFYSMYFLFFAFEGTSQLSQSACLVLFLFGTIGVIFTPGGLGVYPALISSLLIYTYNIDSVTAFAFPWMGWSSQFILVITLGLASLLLMPILNKEKVQENDIL